MTGRYPIRNGMTSAKQTVLFPNSGGGLPAREITIAEMLKQVGYSTGIVGKWHLGHLPDYLPTQHGFDSYFGIPYSNDMDKTGGPGYLAEARKDPNFYPNIEHYNVPLMRNTEIIERPADQNTLTQRYTDEAVRFIREKKNRPFFLYLAHSMPHIPLFASDEYRGKSSRGLYGDVVEELDASVGRILDTLRELKLDGNTMVVFSSDNGPWLSFETHGGSAGPLRAGKGTTFEGGQRVPTIFWWPGSIQPRTIQEMGSTLDLMATIAAITGGAPPKDRTLDSYDLSEVLFRGGKSPRQEMFFWTNAQLHAVRVGPWKLHIRAREQVNYGKAVELSSPELYHLERDISERYNVAEKYPEVVERLLKKIEEHLAGIEPHENMLEITLTK
jgi:arylsulfatase A-like enzyme